MTEAIYSVMILSFDLLTDFACRYVNKEDLLAFFLACKRHASIHKTQLFWKYRYLKDICSSVDENVTDFETAYKNTMYEVLDWKELNRGYYCLTCGYDRIAERMGFSSRSLRFKPGLGLPPNLWVPGYKIIHPYIDFKTWTFGSPRIVPWPDRLISLPPMIFNRMKHLLVGQVVLYHGYYYLPFYDGISEYIVMKPFGDRYLPSLSRSDHIHENIPGVTYIQLFIILSPLDIIRLIASHDNHINHKLRVTCKRFYFGLPAIPKCPPLPEETYKDYRIGGEIHVTIFRDRMFVMYGSSCCFNDAVRIMGTLV